MSALQTLVAAADGTTDESMHVCVPVSVIRELAEEVPDHVAQAAMDEDIRQAAIEWASSILSWYCWSAGEMLPRRYNVSRIFPSGTDGRARVDRALRILRHFGLLVEHGKGVVSIKERS